MNTDKREEIINALVMLGKDIEENMDKEPYLSMYRKVRSENPWFLEDNTKYALQQFLPWLQKDILENFANRYPCQQKRKRLAIVCAGNIPAVSFHDILCGLLSGSEVQIKLSSNDKVLIPFLLNRINKQELLPISYTDKIKDFDFVIATGSNSSSLYFESYFRNCPHIIRKSRSSIAVVTHEDNISGLEDDVFMYLGLGCRNVSLLFLPLGFDMERLKNRFKKYSFLADFHKYKNNYDYYRAVFQMNNVNVIDVGFYLLQENRQLHCPISVVNYCFYKDKKEIESFVEENKEELQCVVAGSFKFNDGIPTVPFGKAQSPNIDDYADNVDTMDFLNKTSF